MKQIGLAVAQYAQDFDELIVPSENGPNGALRSWPTLIVPYVKNEQVFVCPGTDEEAKAPTPGTVTGTGSFFGVTRTIGANGADGSAAALCLVNRLSYGRNLIPARGTAANPAWDAIIANRTCTNGKKYPNFVDYNGNWKYGFAGAIVAGRAGTLGGMGGGTTTELSLADVKDPAGTIHIMDAMATAATNGGSMRGIQQDTRTDLFSDREPSKVDARHNGGYVVLYGDGHSGWKKWGTSTPCQWTVQDDTCN